jgi:hypothetical protein
MNVCTIDFVVIKDVWNEGSSTSTAVFFFEFDVLVVDMHMETALLLELNLCPGTSFILLLAFIRNTT